MMHITVLKVSRYKKTPDILQALDTMFSFLYYQYLELILEPLYLNMPTVRLNRTIDSFHEEQAYHLFRFQKNDLKRLMKALRIPETVITSGRNKFSGEEVMLASLMRLCTLTALDEMAKTYFGRDYTAWSRAIRWFYIHLSQKTLRTDGRRSQTCTPTLVIKPIFNKKIYTFVYDVPRSNV
jgi:hypothetical protein